MTLHLHHKPFRATLVAALSSVALLTGCNSQPSETRTPAQSTASTASTASTTAAVAKATKPANPAGATAAAPTATTPATPTTPAANATSAKAAPSAAKVTAAASAPATARVGSPAPDFTLSDVTGKTHTLSEYAKQGKLVVLEWFNPDCPVSKGYHVPTDAMAATAKAYESKGVVWLAINSGAAGKQGGGLDRNKQAAADYGITYPILLDDSGKVGHLYGAKTTPHMYVIDKGGVLRYAGAIDDGDPMHKGPTNYVRQALDQLLAGQQVSKAETTAFGCGVKYAD